MTRLLQILLIGFVPLAKSESALPDCPADDPSLVWDNCFGTYGYDNGSKYVGEWKDDNFHGRGTYTYADGDKYVGEYKEGKSHGQGTYTFGKESEWADDKYVGEFKDDERHGLGTYTFASGNKYVGEFKDDKYHGQGAFTFAHGEQWRGYYMNGQYVPNICADMGLREGTPQHGQCVLNLMEAVLAESE